MTPQSSFPLALQWNSVDGAVRGVWLCFGTGGNIQCRRGNPFPHGRKAHVSTAGPLAPREAALRSAPLRETLLPRHPDDARSALAIPAPRAPSCRSIMRGRRRSKPAMPRLRRPRSCSTLFYIKARPESILTRRGLCRTTPLNTALFRAGAFQLRSGPPQTVPGLPAFRLRGRFRGWRARIRFPFVPAGSPGMRLPS